MSSNIRVQRICQHCGKQFEAKKTTSQTCSDHCAKMYYKTKQRAAKIEASNVETQRVITQPIDQLKEKEFLSVRDVSKLIGCSRQTVYTLINTGRLKAVNLLTKKTVVKRSDLDKLFEQPQLTPQPKAQPVPIQYEISDCYTLTEVQAKYSISEAALQQLINRNGIPKIKKGWFAYVPKTIIDKLLS